VSNPQIAEPSVRKLSKLAQRATDLNKKAFMPWGEADELALSEAGLSEEDLTAVVEDYHYANEDSVFLMNMHDLYEFSRHLLVWSPLEAEHDATVQSQGAEIERLRAEIEAIKEDADDWSRYVTEDHAPQTLARYLERGAEERAALKQPTE
jgi:hypothetical protein